MAVLSRLIPSARGLFLFEAAARTGSFTAAAAEFNITQPSASRSMAQFEATLGLTLFSRGPRGLELTRDGKELYDVVRDGLGRIADSVEAIHKRRKTSKPQVTLSLSSSFAAHWLVPRLNELNAVFPDVDLRFDLISGTLGYVPENVDLATRIISDEDTRYHRWDFAPEIILPVCSPGYLATHGSLDWGGMGHVLLHLTDHDLQDWAKVWPDARVRRDPADTWHTFSDYSVILLAALNGEGIALGWVSVISSALLKGTLVPASDRRFNIGRYHQLLAPKSRSMKPAVAEIASWLVEQMTLEIIKLKQVLHPGLARGTGPSAPIASGAMPENG